jgi:N-acyl-D-amino-acid deacylase
MLHDPRSLGELTQGVTLQVFGEGDTMGPLRPEQQRMLEREAPELGLEIGFSRLSEYLSYVESQGCSQNVASFVGNGTLRPYVMGYDDRAATARELDQMRALVDEEMADGALGLSTALIYPPETYTSTAELIALCEPVARHGGAYVSHLRDEGPRLVEAVEELLTISESAGVPAEIDHLTASGRRNWHLMPQVLERIEVVRAQGRPITADVYPYPASSTGLTSIIPQEFHEGGQEVLFDRLADPAARAAISAAMKRDDRWSQEHRADEVLLLHFRTPPLRQHQGRTLADVAADRDEHPVDTALHLIGADRSRVGVAFFSMSEENLAEQLRPPWVSICSDGSSVAPEGVSLQSPTHPRTYGSFARVLRKYVREDRVLTLAEAVDRMTRLPAANFGFTGRGRLEEGAYADLVVFDPDTVADVATFEDPHRLSVGVTDVIVNGRTTIRKGAFTGTLAGRAVRRGTR